MAYRLAFSREIRLWIGRDYRLVWRVSDEEQLVEIEYIGYKTPDLYAQLGLARP